MQVSFQTQSSGALQREPTAKEISKTFSQALPGLEVSVAKVNDTVIGFFSNGKIEELSPTALLTLVKKIAPEGIVVDWNFKTAPEEVLRQHFLLPAPQSREIKLKGFEHLTPSFMESLAEARPNLRKIDLRKTKKPLKLLDAFLSKQHALLSQSNQEVQKELREKIATRAELIQARNHKHLKKEELEREKSTLSKEIAVLQDLAQKAEEAAKDSPTVAGYGESMSLKAEELREKLSYIEGCLTLYETTETTEEIDSLSQEIAALRNRFLDLDSVAVEILIEGSNLDSYEKRGLYHKYPHIVLIGEDSSLDLSHSHLSMKQILDKLTRLPQVKTVDLHGIPNLELADILHLEKKLGVSAWFSAPSTVTPAKTISVDGELVPLSAELLTEILNRFPGISSVKLMDWKEATPLDILYLEDTFPKLHFYFPPQEKCELAIFDFPLIERLADRFPTLTVQLGRMTVEEEEQLLLLADHFPQVDFLSENRVRHALDNLDLLKLHLKRASRKSGKTCFSLEELESLAILQPLLAPLIERIIGYRQGKMRTGLTVIQEEIESLDFTITLRHQQEIPSDQAIPYALAKLLEKFHPKPVPPLSNGSPKAAPEIEEQIPIVNAAKRGDAEEVKLLIASGVDFDTEDSVRSARTPLFHAAENGHTAVVKLLLENGANVNRRNHFGFTPLLTAAKNGHLEVIKLLLEYKAEFLECKELIHHPLSLAAGNGHMDLVRYFLDKGAKVDQKNSSHRTALSYATEKGQFEMVKFLLNKGADLLSEGYSGYTPFTYAAMHGHTELVKFLFEKIDRNNVYGVSFAAENGHIDVIKFLLDKMSPTDQDLFSALGHAAENGRLDIATLLVEKGVNAAEVKGHNYERMPIVLAAKNGHAGMAKFLLENGAHWKPCPHLGSSYSALHMAAEHGHADVVKVILEKGVDVNDQSQDLSNALIAAAGRGNLEIVRQLLEKIANIKHCFNLSESYLPGKDDRWIGALALAAEKGYLDLAKLLLEKGAGNGYALGVAVRGGRIEMVKLFVERFGVLGKLSSLEERSQLLIDAVKHGRTDIAKFLVKKGIDVNYRKYGGQTVLMHAKQECRLDIVDFLEKRGAKE